MAGVKGVEGVGGVEGVERDVWGVLIHSSVRTASMCPSLPFPFAHQVQASCLSSLHLGEKRGRGGRGRGAPEGGRGRGRGAPKGQSQMYTQRKGAELKKKAWK